ncbi:DMT family transporter [Pendulispora albinea]|uniref:DMT family transporter n=1 Tax=Pendulispora albinea TaxID=2741071 RepID=A0ABZ2LVD6_9BACT
MSNLESAAGSTALPEVVARGNGTRGNPWEWALIGVTAIWGWTFVTVHDAVAQIAVSTFLAYRFTVATVVMALALLPVLRQLTKKELVGGIAAGTILFAAYAFQTAGLLSTTPSNAGFITGLSVVFTPIFAFVLLRIKPLAQQVAGAALAAVGLALLTMRGLEVHRGDALVLCCAIAFALHILILSRVSPGAHPGRLTLVQLATVGVLSTLWAGGAGELVLPPNGQVWLALSVTAVIASSFAFFIQTKAQATTPANRIALILTLEPVFGGLFGYWLSGDRLTPTNLVGAALILMATIVTELRWRRDL